MIISHLRLKNWRNFTDVNVQLKNRVFLVGPNACGKSNFLDALKFLRDICKQGGGLQKAVQDRGGISKIRCLAARQEPDVEIEVQLANNSDEVPSWKYAIGIRQEPRGYRHPYLVYENICEGNQQLLDRPDDKDKKDKLRLTQTHLEQITANEKFRAISRFFDSVSYLHLVPQLVRSPEAFAGPGIPGDPFGRNFLERVAKAQQRTRRSRLKTIEQALVKAVPQLKHLADVKDEVGMPHLEVVYEHWRPMGAKQREDQFSDGTLRLIALIWMLLESDSLLLLEEPELSLNAAIIRSIPAIIHRLQKKRNRQVILSTHNADLLSDKGIDGKEVLLMTPGTEGTSVKEASSIKEVRDLLEGGFTVAEAVMPRAEPKTYHQGLLFDV
ncbi:MAG: chromosome segregation protein SMC [Planctomycetota bacterium]|nr:MAG: chromosome segregation protein SMC [Planctomycetota bacterium]